MKDTVKNPKPSPTANGAQQLVVNFGTRNRDAFPIEQKMTWAALTSQLSVPDTTRGTLPLAEYLALDKEIPKEKRIRNAEKDGAYFIMGSFSKPGTRDAADIAFMTGFVGDIDSGTVSKEDLLVKLKGLEYIVYSSYSHGPIVPKWRFILPYPTPVSVADHKRTYAHWQQVFDGQLDTRCNTPAQLWYTPACPPDAGPYFEFITGVGDLFDPASVPVVVAAPTTMSSALTVMPIKPLKSLSSYQLERLNSALGATPADDRDDWIRVGMALKQELGADAGRTLWMDWSRKSLKFDEDDADATWDSFNDIAPASAVTLGTVFYLAKENGWIDQQREMHEKVRALDDIHFVAFEGGKCWVFKEDFDQELNRPVLTRIALKAFGEFYANQKVAVQNDDKTIMVDIAYLWHKHPARRTFDKVVFMPGLPTPLRCYNLWRGFPIPPVKGDWSLLRQHILEIICDGDTECEEYLLNWMAYAIQHPDRKGEVAIVMKGERGTGKGKVAQLLGMLFGEHSLQVTQTRHLIGHFNAHLRACVFLFADEALWAGDKEGENALKALVTEDTLQIEGKGVNVITAPTRLHIMMASNNDWVVPAGNKERRFFVLRVSSKRIQDHAYFAAIDDQMLNKGGLSAMMFDLVHRNISAFNVRKFKWTDALDDQVLRSLDPAMQWWMDHLGKTHPCWQFQKRETLSEDFAKSNGTFNCKSSETKLGMFLNKVVPVGLKKVQHSFLNVARSAYPPPAPTECYEFPDQGLCRQELQRQLGLKKDPWA